MHQPKTSWDSAVLAWWPVQFVANDRLVEVVRLGAVIEVWIFIGHHVARFYVYSRVCIAGGENKRVPRG